MVKPPLPEWEHKFHIFAIRFRAKWTAFIRSDHQPGLTSACNQESVKYRRVLTMNRPLIAVSLAAACLLGFGLPAKRRLPNQPDARGAVTLPNGWRITPAGKQI